LRPTTIYEHLQIYDGLRQHTKKGRKPWTDHERRMVMEASYRSSGLFYEASVKGELIAGAVCYTTDNPVAPKGKNVMAAPGHFLYVVMAWAEKAMHLRRLWREAIETFPQITYIAYHRKGKLETHEVRRAQTELRERGVEGQPPGHLRSVHSGADRLPWEVQPDGAGGDAPDLEGAGRTISG
jgi:hypothetical protein